MRNFTRSTLERVAEGIVLLLLILGIPWAQENDPNRKCMICHGKKEIKTQVAPGKYKSLYIDYKEFRSSVHGEKACTDCHTDVVMIPHPRKPKRIHCLQCHYEGNVVNAPVEKSPEKYKESVHGKALKRGDPKAPDCYDCHTTHYVRSPKDTLSTVNRKNVIRTCGHCHLKEFSDYSDGIHGKAVRAGDPDAPVCNDCHTEHDILPPTDPRSTLYPKNVIKTCGKCHADVKMMKRKGVPVKQVEAFKESFHGIALEYGIVTAANCVSCHGAHLILPSSDPKSPIHPANLVKTCGKCHPRAGENVARGKFHIIPEERSAGIVYYVGLFFKWFTLLVLAGLMLHIVLDIIGRIKRSAA
jgi:hypothetical protein